MVETIGVVGSRNFDDYHYLVQVLNRYNFLNIVSGGAEGADQLAESYAIDHNINFQEFLPDWDKYGKSAGPRRNQQIVEASDELIVFWDGKSKGAKSTINLARQMKVPVHIYWI